MKPPDLSEGRCTKLSPRTLEATFHYPGPQSVDQRPTAFAQEAWNEAKEHCLQCPVLALCRERNWGLEYGVVGGTDQYERYLYRRKIGRHLSHMDEAERAALAAQMYARHGRGLGDSAETISRQTGYTAPAVRGLVDEHQALLDAQRVERQASGSTPWVDAPEFPEKAPPRADGWVWYLGQAHRGHYVAQTEDGAYVRMKIKRSGAQTSKWFATQVVDLRTPITPVIQTWIGRPDAPERSVRTPANKAKTHCPQGHEYTLENTQRSPRGDRQCRQCKRARDRVYKKQRGGDHGHSESPQPLIA